MGKWNPGAKRYLCQVRSWLPCSGKMKRMILKEIRDRISQFCGENPGADYTALVDRFGQPRQIAGSYVDELDTQRLLKDLRIRGRILAIVTATACLALMLWTGVIAVSYERHTVQTLGIHAEQMQVEERTEEPDGAGTRGTVTAIKDKIYYDAKGNIQYRLHMTATFSYDGKRSECVESECEVYIYDPSWYVVSQNTTGSDFVSIGDVVMGNRILGVTVLRDGVDIVITCSHNGIVA